MNNDAFVQSVRELTTFKLRSQNVLNEKQEVPEIITKELLQSVEDLGFKILPDKAIVDDFRMEEANLVISNWLPEGIEPSDVNSAQIFSDLKSRGWLILPPQ